jgi:photosystem II stability/assembly factor-like uncharacterized protein
VSTRTTKRRPPKVSAVQARQQRATLSSAPLRWFLGGLIATLAIAAIIVVAIVKSGEGDNSTAPPPTAAAAAGLPNTSDYHSLAVNPSDPRRVLLGTHQGLYSSTDGGKTWTFATLSGQDAMNLARVGAQTLWTAGHNVFAKSVDGGQTWMALDPKGLPSLDLHGFATDPRHARTVYAAVAGQGLYRSTDNGISFSRISKDVGGSVMALAVTPAGDILAGDMERGLLVSADCGASWRRVLSAQLMGLALNPNDPKRILAVGPGIMLSTNGGRTWRQRLEVSGGAGPVAWSPRDPDVAYAVGFDRTLYRSADGGQTWSAVG